MRPVDESGLRPVGWPHFRAYARIAHPRASTVTEPVKSDSFPCVCSALRRSARATSRIYDDALAPSGLNVGQYAVLVVLARRGPVAVSALADELVMDRTTLSRSLQPLERE